MSKNLAKELSPETQRSTADPGEVSAAERTEIHCLRAKICRIQDENAKCLSAIAEWKEKATQFRLKLDQIQEALVRDSGTTQNAVCERSRRPHRARTRPG
jgi:hypothetical protein